ncbi:MAG: PQQ-dependent sugar dehydrogenase [Nitrospirae bacterium]|nr:PQQ-dependent sugar dehydrogenase [Nitrospirota bacterium]
MKHYCSFFLNFFTVLLICTPVYAEEIKLLRIEKFVDGVDFPVALCYYDKDTILFTEKSGSVKVVKNGKLQAEPLNRFDVTTGFERGLLGIACKDKKVYVYYTYRDIFRTYNRVVSFHPEKILLDKIPGAVIHNGGILTIGPDGKLYISTGDARDKERAQDIHSPSGKVLRINLDGTVPDDNPYKGSPVWSIGHRNVFGTAFDEKGDLYITENGTDRDDEINLIKKGKNYGWPLVLGFSDDKKFENPIKTFTPNIAPTNATFFDDWFVFGAWNTGEIIGLKIKDKKVIEERVLYRHKSGITDVKFFPDGYLYFLSRDGIYRATFQREN